MDKVHDKKTAEYSASLNMGKPTTPLAVCLEVGQKSEWTATRQLAAQDQCLQDGSLAHTGP